LEKVDQTLVLKTALIFDRQVDENSTNLVTLVENESKNLLLSLAQNKTQEFTFTRHNGQHRLGFVAFRATRLEEFSHIGRFLNTAVFLKITKGAQIFGLLFSHKL
jgi:hypothetical protein